MKNAVIADPLSYELESHDDNSDERGPTWRLGFEVRCDAANLITKSSSSMP